MKKIVLTYDESIPCHFHSPKNNICKLVTLPCLGWIHGRPEKCPFNIFSDKKSPKKPPTYKTINTCLSCKYCSQNVCKLYMFQLNIDEYELGICDDFEEQL